MRRPPLRISVPESVDAVLLAQALVGPDYLVKAEVRKDWRTHPFHRYEAMNELYDRIIGMYRRQVKRMVAAIVSKVEARDPALRKAEPPKSYKPLMTPDQLQQIAQLIRDYHTSIIASITPGQLSPDEVQGLIDAGIMPPEALDVMKDAYLYGHLMATIRSMGEPARVRSMPYEEFKERIERKPIATTPHEDEAIAWARHSAAVHVRGLGNKIADDFSTIAIEADAELRKRYEDTIREKLEENIDRRETWRDLASELGHATEDWSRDFGRIAATEKQRAMQEGFSEGLIKKHGSPNAVLVSKIPAAGACKHCIALHLTGGEGSPPKVFPLQELRANGSNVGRKAADWRPVVGTVHPWCFPADTPIEIEDGQETFIKNVGVGTLVRTHLGRIRAVQRLSKRHHCGDLIVLRAGGETMRTTAEHPLLTQRGWVAAGLVIAGDCLMQVSQSDELGVHYHDVPIESISREPFDGLVYNFSVEEDESYVAHGFVVHNCQCELVEVPAGWGWEDSPPEDSGWEPVPGREGAFRKRREGADEDDDKAWTYWSPDLMPEGTRKSEVAFARDLRKALAQPSWLSYGDSVGTRGCSIRVADPRVHMAVKRVIDATPPQLFDKRIGVTMVTTDHPRPQVALTDHDLAYWTGNEVRLSQHLTADKVEHVLTHEIGHSLNVYLIHKLGGIDAVRAWHDELDAVSKREGYVSSYASTLPIENAAEATKLYIYAPRRMQREYPKQYEFLRRAYGEVLDQGARA